MNIQVTYQAIYLLFLLPLFISNILDDNKKDSVNIIMNKIFIFIILKIILTLCGWALDGQIQYVFLNKLFSVAKFGLGVPAIIYFTKYVIEVAGFQSSKTKKILITMQIYCTMIIIFDILSIFFPLIFIFENGYYIKGPAYNIYHMLFLGTLIFSMIIIYMSKDKLSNRQFLFMFGYLVSPIIGILFSLLKEIRFDFINLSTTLALTIFYVTVHIDRGRKLAIKEKELTDTKVSLMISQIQPHFLYNALTAISILCDINPKQARIATDEFSDYLRGNLEALSQKKPILFDKELHHVKAYLHLEKIRFGDKLNIIYNIENHDFFIPALSLQPIVENAVKHGLSKKIDGGTISISTKEFNLFYQIIVADDGVGFDPNRLTYDNNMHIGLDNVKLRLKTMIAGHIEISSIKNKGTTVIITIPK